MPPRMGHLVPFILINVSTAHVVPLIRTDCLSRNRLPVATLQVLHELFNEVEPFIFDERESPSYFRLKHLETVRRTHFTLSTFRSFSGGVTLPERIHESQF